MIGWELRDQLPAAEMAEHEDDRSSPAQLAVHFVCPLDLDTRRDLLDRHRVELHAAEEIGAEILKMAPNDPVFFCRGFFFAEGNLDVTAGQPAIVGQAQPGEKTERLSEEKIEPQRQRGDQSQGRAVEEVNAKIDHAGQPPKTWNEGSSSVILPASGCNHYNVLPCSRESSQRSVPISRASSRANSRPPGFSSLGTKPPNSVSKAGRTASRAQTAPGSPSSTRFGRMEAGHALTSPFGFIRPRSSRPTTARCSSA